MAWKEHDSLKGGREKSSIIPKNVSVQACQLDICLTEETAKHSSQKEDSNLYSHYKPFQPLTPSPKGIINVGTPKDCSYVLLG